MFQSYIMIFSDFILEIKKKKREKWIACVVHEYEIGFDEGSQILFDKFYLIENRIQFSCEISHLDSLKNNMFHYTFLLNIYSDPFVCLILEIVSWFWEFDEE